MPLAIETYEVSPTGKVSIKKDPNAVLDYTFNWAEYLALITDTIVSVTWVLSTGLTNASNSFTTTTARIFVSGGVLGAEEFITCRIVTTGGRTDDRTIFLKIRAR